MKSSTRQSRLIYAHVSVASKLVALLGMTAGVIALAVEQQHTPATIEPLYRAHRFEATPKLNPKTTFRIRELDVPHLWSALRLQLFDAEDMIDGQTFSSRQFLWNGSSIQPFVESFGGQGAMSAVVHDGALYYSYSFGSGIHRSLVGRMTLHDGELVKQESEALLHSDMFVEVINGRVHVVEGKWRGFNRWENSRLLGWIDIGEQKRLRIVDDQDRELQLRARLEMK